MNTGRIVVESEQDLISNETMMESMNQLSAIVDTLEDEGCSATLNFIIRKRLDNPRLFKLSSSLLVTWGEEEGVGLQEDFIKG